MRIGLLVSGNLGLVLLRELYQEKDLVFVMTDSKSDGIIAFCQEKGLPCFKGNPRNGRAGEFLENKPIDVLLSVNYLFIIEQDIISIPQKWAINVHGSLLPRYRGRTPHVWSIINNEPQAGITAHLINEECDAGDILLQIPVPIGPEMTGAELLEKYNDLYPGLIKEVLARAESNTLTPRAQDHSLATYFGKRTPEDGNINWEWQKERIYNWVRAQAKPYPGAFTHCGENRIFVHKVRFTDFGFAAEQPNGLVLKGGEKPVVKTPNGAVELFDIQDAHGRPVILETNSILN